MSPPLYMISPHQYFLTIETRIIRPSLLFVRAKRWRPRLIKVKYLSDDYWHPWKMVLRILRVRLPLMTVQFTRRMALFRSSGYIGGRWKDTDCDAKFPVYNPATGEEIGKVANMGRSDAEEAVIQAYNAFKSWKNVTTNVR